MWPLSRTLSYTLWSKKLAPTGSQKAKDNSLLLCSVFWNFCLYVYFYCFFSPATKLWHCAAQAWMNCRNKSCTWAFVSMTTIPQHFPTIRFCFNKLTVMSKQQLWSKPAEYVTLLPFLLFSPAVGTLSKTLLFPHMFFFSPLWPLGSVIYNVCVGRSLTLLSVKGKLERHQHNIYKYIHYVYTIFTIHLFLSQLRYCGLILWIHSHQGESCHV